MPSSFPSIQSFYQREVPSSNSPSEPPTCRTSGDAFTSSEVEAALDPHWMPKRHYEQSPIYLLNGGPHNYEITGRVVNFSSNVPGRNHSNGGEGQCFVVISDGSAALAVKIYYLNTVDYHPFLGQRVTIWATYIADSTAAQISYIPFVNQAMTLYPGRNGATHVSFHHDEDGSAADQTCRTPLGLSTRKDEFMQGLMTLHTFISGGFDIGGDAKILVSVRSIGPRKTIRSKKHERTFDLLEVGVCDGTATSILKLWNEMTLSTRSWIPNETVLLISAPTCRALDQPKDKITAEICIGYSSMVEVNPDFQEARWLRKKMNDMTKKERVITPCPQDLWDIDAAIKDPDRRSFTIAEIDEHVRQHPTANLIGKLNVIVLEMYLLENWRRGTTCCFDCCGLPLYAKRTIATCKNCEEKRQLSLNPRIVGSLVDESGVIHGGKLVWSDQAWTQLFFGNPENTTEVDLDEADYARLDLVDQSWEDLLLLDSVSLRDFEDQILYSRLTVTFGWSAELERICILAIEW